MVLAGGLGHLPRWGDSKGEGCRCGTGWGSRQSPFVPLPGVRGGVTTSGSRGRGQQMPQGCSQPATSARTTGCAAGMPTLPPPVYSEDAAAAHFSYHHYDPGVGMPRSIMIASGLTPMMQAMAFGHKCLLAAPWNAHRCTNDDSYQHVTREAPASAGSHGPGDLDNAQRSPGTRRCSNEGSRP